VRGLPAAILLVEFGEDDNNENIARLRQLHELIGDLGFAWSNSGAKWGGVVDVLDPGLQAAITDVRTSGLNIMMSMKDSGKPVSFVEDCAVPLEHLADYTTRLTAIFEKNGTRGTWYAHAGSGCLHVRPVLNLRLEKTSMPCARLPKRRSRWSANTRARIRANTATAWSARNSTSRCLARGWRAPSRR
jgi:FAD/FMN-containing dehydrogenase